LGQETVVDLLFSTDRGEAGGSDRNRPADPAEIYRRAWDGVMPLRVNETRRGSIGDLEFRGKAIEGPGQSLVETDAPNVVVLALKQARSAGAGQYTLRLLEIAGRKETAVKVRLPQGAARAWLADQTERAGKELKLQDGRVELPLTAHEIATIRFDVK
jgi:alpha-mannosidase